ncbi:MAG: hypothetical protein JWM16_6441 [Verrucomicrobiales bacterium]|nr:hypothetical protein [Verrucomicrobiales bacterium]
MITNKNGALTAAMRRGNLIRLSRRDHLRKKWFRTCIHWFRTLRIPHTNVYLYEACIHISPAKSPNRYPDTDRRRNSFIAQGRAMRYLFILSAFLPCLAFSQVKKEEVPNLEDHLAVSTDIESSADFTAPRMEGSLHGLEANLPAVRSAESVFEEVQQNQSRLTYLYKTWSIKEEDGVGPRTYGLTLTIGSSGEVEKVTVKGPTNKDFIKEVQANIMSWSFSKVKAGKSYVANLKNLDFMFRKNLVLE